MTYCIRNAALFDFRWTYTMRTLHNSECSVSSRYWLSRVALTDASFCSLLNDDCLAVATVACPSIKLLVLMLCTSVGLEGLLALRRLSNLTLLDMSYLQPIIDSCPQLKVFFKLQVFKYLENTALIPLHKGRALPNLCDLKRNHYSWTLNRWLSTSTQ